MNEGSPSFERVADELLRRSRLSRLETRGTLRLALKIAGLLPKTVTSRSMMVVLERILPEMLARRGVRDAEELCDALVVFERIHGANDPPEDSPETVFARLAGARPASSTRSLTPPPRSLTPPPHSTPPPPLSTPPPRSLTPAPHSTPPPRSFTPPPGAALGPPESAPRSTTAAPSSVRPVSSPRPMPSSRSLTPPPSSSPSIPASSRSFPPEPPSSGGAPSSGRPPVSAPSEPESRNKPKLP